MLIKATAKKFNVGRLIDLEGILLSKMTSPARYVEMHIEKLTTPDIAHLYIFQSVSERTVTDS